MPDDLAVSTNSDSFQIMAISSLKIAYKHGVDLFISEELTKFEVYDLNKLKVRIIIEPDGNISSLIRYVN